MAKILSKQQGVVVVTGLIISWLAAVSMAQIILSPIPTPQVCFAAVSGVRGCLSAISQANLNTPIEKSCCQAINRTDTRCWPMLFPNFVGLNGLLKAICANLGILPPVSAPVAAPPLPGILPPVSAPVAAPPIRGILPPVSAPVAAPTLPPKI